MSEQVLIHYGVPGMRWGVRRDARIIANHRRNVEVSLQKNKYKTGKITKEQYIAARKKATAEKKKYMSDVENKYRNAKSEKEIAKLDNDITKTAIKEVPNLTVKRGLAVVNQMLAIYDTTTVAATTGMLAVANPAFAAAYVGAGAVTIAAEAGYRYVTRSLLDKTS